jgi:hypothetical protein
MKIAKLNYNKIEEILIDPDPMPPNTDGYQFFDITDITPEPSIGMVYIGDDVFIWKSKRVTKLEFRNKFTASEKVLIDNFETSSLSDVVKSNLRTIFKDFDAAGYIDLSRTDTQQAVQYFAYVGLITFTRAGEILA